jgi:hypothetical protein
VEYARESRNEFMRLMLSFGKTLEEAAIPDIKGYNMLALS